MDRIIMTYPHAAFGELNYCFKHGILYQRDMNASVEYGESYFQHYVEIENSEIAQKLNKGRTGLTEKYCQSVLDIGIGSGEFIKSSNIKVLGYDINPLGVKWLKDRDLFFNPYEEDIEADGVTFWDSLEHIPQPDHLLDRIKKNTFVFISMPIFTDLVWIRKSKHYKPNEHYYYFTADGMVNWMLDHGFDVVEVSDFETVAGRENILTFVFNKNY